MKSKVIGLGSTSAQLKVHIANIPPLAEYSQLMDVKPIAKGEIAHISGETGNHWRKIFNVYAKLVFELDNRGYLSWQELRENDLLQVHSNESLIFSAPDINSLTCSVQKNSSDKKEINIVMGKTYAQSLGVSEHCHWLDLDFAVNSEARLIICPYFDYRQLSNIKIKKLATLIEQLLRA